MGYGLLLFCNIYNLNPVNDVFPLSKAGSKMLSSEGYEYGGVKPADINNGTMDVVEAEVYSVTGRSLRNMEQHLTFIYSISTLNT